MRTERLLWIVLGMALLLRLTFALSLDTAVNPGSDSGWYLGNGYTLVTGKQPPGMTNEVSNLASPPLYLILIGIPQAFLPVGTSLIAIRVFQAVLSTATCYFAYRLALLLTGRASAGLIAAGALAISPVFIIEAAQILTETTYVFLVAGGMWLYLEGITNHEDAKVESSGKLEDPSPPAPLPHKRGEGRITDGFPNFRLETARNRALALLLIAAALFGLATLTRAVLLAFPLALAVYLLIARQGWKRAALFLLVYALVVSTWTVYSLARWNRFVIAGQGLEAMFYLGTTGWSGPQSTDQQLAEVSPDLNYTEGAQAAISRNPLGWIRRRVGELAGAYLQPHGTTFYPGASLRDLTLDWLREDGSITGFITLTRGNGFWPKLVLYAMHYFALAGGVAGAWVYRKHWRIGLPMLGFIAYLTLVHLALLALPRYLFPNEIFWWVFAAAGLSRLVPSQQHADP